MNRTEQNRRAMFLDSLKGLDDVLDTASIEGNHINRSSVNVLCDELARIEEAFPDLLPPFTLEDYRATALSLEAQYHIDALRAYLATAMARLRDTQ